MGCINHCLNAYPGNIFSLKGTIMFLRNDTGAIWGQKALPVSLPWSTPLRALFPLGWLSLAIREGGMPNLVVILFHGVHRKPSSNIAFSWFSDADNYIVGLGRKLTLPYQIYISIFKTLKKIWSVINSVFKLRISNFSIIIFRVLRWEWSSDWQKIVL